MDAAGRVQQKGHKQFCIESPPASPCTPGQSSLTPMSVVQTPHMLGISSMYLLKNRAAATQVPLSPFLPAFIRYARPTPVKASANAVELSPVSSSSPLKDLLDITDSLLFPNSPASPCTCSPAPQEDDGQAAVVTTPLRATLPTPRTPEGSPAASSPIGGCGSPIGGCGSPICENAPEEEDEDMEDDEELDDFGFLLELSKQNNIDNSGSGMQRHPEAEEQLVAQWRRLMSPSEGDGDGQKLSGQALKLQVSNMVKSGIPHSIRGEVWSYLASCSQPMAAPWVTPSEAEERESSLEPILRLKLHSSSTSAASKAQPGNGYILQAMQGDGNSEAEKIYEEYVARGPNEHSDQIKLDIFRTFTTHSVYRKRGGEGQARLERLLLAFSYHNEEIGYCQGMSYVAALILLYVEKEAQAFWLFDWMLDNERVGEYYIRTMTGVIRDSGTFEQLLKTHYPLLHDHLQNANVHPLMYITPWFMAMFTHLGNWRTVLRVFDLFFFEGNDAIFRSSLAIMHISQERLLSTEGIDQALPFLQNIPAECCAEESLMPVACALPIHHYVPHATELARKAAEKEAAEKEERAQALARAREKKRLEKERQELAASSSKPNLFDRFITSITPKSRRQSSVPMGSNSAAATRTSSRLAPRPRGAMTPNNGNGRALKQRSDMQNRSMSVIDARIAPKESPKKRKRTGQAEDVVLLLQSPPKKKFTTTASKPMANRSVNTPNANAGLSASTRKELQMKRRQVRQRRSTTAIGRGRAPQSPVMRRRGEPRCDSPLKQCVAASPRRSRRLAEKESADQRHEEEQEHQRAHDAAHLLSPKVRGMRRSPSQLDSPLSPFTKPGMMEMRSLSPSQQQRKRSCRKSLAFSSPRSPKLDIR